MQRTKAEMVDVGVLTAILERLAEYGVTGELSEDGETVTVKLNMRQAFVLLKGMLMAMANGSRTGESR